MKSSKKTRFLLSTFTAALIVFAWTGASHAGELYVASGHDDFGNPVVVDINVTSVVIPFDGVHESFATQITLTYTNLSPSLSQEIGDIMVGILTPITFFTVSGSGVLNDWTQTTTFDPFVLTLTSQDAADDIASHESVTLTIDTDVGSQGTNLRVSAGHQEITATLVPEPSSMVLATFGALGFVGYSLRRRIAK